MNRTGFVQAWPMTRAVKYLIIANSTLWVLTVIAGRLGSTALYEEMALTPSLVYPGLHIWQIFSYMWVHSLSNFFHIVLNMLFLWMFGGVLEQRWGSSAFLRFYIICGVGAGVVVLLVGWPFYPTTPTVGSSGAIFGLVAAWAITFPDRMIYLMGVFPIKGKYFAMIPIGFAVLEFLVGGTGVSHAAHLGGLAMGALLVTGFWRPSRLTRRLRYIWLRRRLKSLDGGKRKPPPNGGYWN